MSNLVLSPSGLLDNPPWTPIGVSVVENDTADQNGDMFSDSLIEDLATSQHGVAQSVTFDLSDFQEVTPRLYRVGAILLPAANRPIGFLKLTGGSFQAAQVCDVQIIVDLVAGSLLDATCNFGRLLDVVVAAAGNSYYQCEFHFQALQAVQGAPQISGPALLTVGGAPTTTLEYEGTGVKCLTSALVYAESVTQV